MPIVLPARRLPPILILGASLLTACGGQDSATLVAEARAMAAAGDYKVAIIQLKNAVAEDDKNHEVRNLYALRLLAATQLRLGRPGVLVVAESCLPHPSAPNTRRRR
ncbi:MAG: hypothetical protein K0M58_07965 [Thiobacillus sp.]|nr:hypothetical protein [Thiobacillus sp.]